MIIALGPEDIFTVALIISSRRFDYFECKHDNVAPINLHQLYKKLIKMKTCSVLMLMKGRIKKSAFCLRTVSSHSNNLCPFLESLYLEWALMVNGLSLQVLYILIFETCKI